MVAKSERNSDKSGGDAMSKFYWILGVVAVLGVAAVSYSVVTSASGEAATSPVEVEGLNDPQQLVRLAQGVVKGNENAPITIVEFADFQCPGCAQFANLVMPQVMKEYVESGQAKMVFYDFPITSIHPHAFLAARAARCAGDQDRFWEYHDALYANQQEWSYAGDASGHFVEYAGEVGLDGGAFDDCLQSDRFADVVTANMRLGEELGVPGTPTVMVSGGAGAARRIQNNNFQSIAQAVQEVRAAAGAQGGEAPAGDPSGG